MARTSRKSPLSARTNQKRNTAGRRNQMARSSFALPKGTGRQPGKDQYRIDDAAHARNALARVSQFGSAGEQRTVRRKVAARFPSIGRTNSTSSKRRKTTGRKR